MRLSTLAPIDVRLVRDGADPFPPAFVATNAPDHEVAAALAGIADESGSVRLPYNSLLIRAEGEVVVVDTGHGTYGTGSGGLEAALEAEGVGADDVTCVLITHAHPDHIGGLWADGRPRFRNARHLISEPEWAFWEGLVAEGRCPPPIATPFEEQLRPLALLGVLERVEPGSDVLPDVRLLPAPGHTPGHLALAVGRGPERLLYLADAVVHPLHFERLDWVGVGDHDAAGVRETRELLLADAADEQLVVAASHLWQAGRVARRDGSFVFLPDRY